MTAFIIIVIVVGFIGLIIASVILGRRTRGDLFASLKRLGLNPQMAERGRPEEYIGEDWKGKSQGLIEIQGSPIRWVNVLKEERQDDSDVYTNVYLVPSPSRYAKAYDVVESVREKSVPTFGRVVAIRWKANFEGDLIRRINEDVSLKESLIKLNEDVTIRSTPEYGCWAIVSRRYPTSWFGLPCRQRAPSRAQWECYETITRHLLESSGK